MTDAGPPSGGREPDDRVAGGDFRIERLHHVQLAIPPGGEDVARRFYADLIGLAELPKPPELAARGGCWFGGGAVEIHLGVEAGFRPAAKAHPGIVVTNLDALAGRLAAAGAEVRWDDGFPGHRRFYTHDWHGNRLELLEPVRG
ncbi:MAG: VOC family protein [Streptosporangiaceae bacterium]